MNSEHMATGLLHLMRRLTEVMNIEIDLLKNNRPGDLEELQPEKAALASAYDDQMRQLREKPGLLDNVEGPLRQELHDESLAFHTALKSNLAAISAARKVGERVVQAISNAVTDHLQPKFGYSRSGSMARERQGISSFALAFDDRV